MAKAKTSKKRKPTKKLKTSKVGKMKSDKKFAKEPLISKFIKGIAEENYAEAHKYLQQVIEEKLQARIAATIKPNLF